MIPKSLVGFGPFFLGMSRFSAFIVKTFEVFGY